MYSQHSKQQSTLPRCSIKSNKWTSYLFFGIFLLSLSGCGGQGAEDPLEGFWKPKRYVLSNGQSKTVDGHISFGQNQWSVVFFILDEAGNVINASAEGGRYELRNDNLTFWHRYNMSDVDKGNDANLRRVIYEEDEQQKEHCTIELDDGILVIYFPSGNAMIFSRDV